MGFARLRRTARAPRASRWAAPPAGSGGRRSRGAGSPRRARALAGSASRKRREAARAARRRRAKSKRWSLIVRRLHGRVLGHPLTLSLPLTARAVVGAARAEHHTRDPRAAGGARLAAARVDAALALVLAVAPVRRHVVADARAARLDRTLEHAVQTGGDRVALAARDARGASRRPPARAEERLVRVDVPDASEDRLIEQEILDRHAPLARRGEQPRAVDLERVDAEPREARVRFA